MSNLPAIMSVRAKVKLTAIVVALAIIIFVTLRYITEAYKDFKFFNYLFGLLNILILIFFVIEVIRIAASKSSFINKILGSKLKTQIMVFVPLIFILGGLLLSTLFVPTITPVPSNGKDVTSQADITQPPVAQPQLTLEQKLVELKATPDYVNPITNLGYPELFRNSETYRGKYVRYSGKVVQVLGEPGNWNLRVSVTKGEYNIWTDVVLIQSFSKERVIENDVIEFTGLSNGTFTYKSSFNTEITVPLLIIYEHVITGRV